jgi:tRNA (adenine22-N1)-methyltransferase
MKLSKRLTLLASLVPKNYPVVDIGCDHGLLDIYLTKYNNNLCIASDIKESALNQAINNFKKYDVLVPSILSDGLSNIEIKDNMIVVIAGMGTDTIKKIIDTKKGNLINTYIIQTNNDYYELRSFMIKKGYYINDEIAFIDQGIAYVIIKFNKGNKNYSEIEKELGPILINKKDNDTKEYFNYLYNKKEEILKQIPSNYENKIKDIEIIKEKIKETGLIK